MLTNDDVCDWWIRDNFFFRALLNFESSQSWVLRWKGFVDVRFVMSTPRFSDFSWPCLCPRYVSQFFFCNRVHVHDHLVRVHDHRTLLVTVEAKFGLVGKPRVCSIDFNYLFGAGFSTWNTPGAAPLDPLFCVFTAYGNKWVKPKAWNPYFNSF